MELLRRQQVSQVGTICHAPVSATRRRLEQRVLIIDNGLTDGSVATLQSRGNIETIDDGNLGFASAVNWAAQDVDAEFHIMLSLGTVVLDPGY